MRLLLFILFTMVFLLAPLPLKEEVLYPLWLLMVLAVMWSVIARVAEHRNNAERREFRAMLRGDRRVGADYLL